MHIAFFEIEPWEKRYFEKHLANHTLSFFSEPLRCENAKKAVNADAISVFIYSKLDAETLAQLPKVRTVTTRSTGMDHIDTDFCNNHKIRVFNVPTYGINTVAEHAFALILALSRRIPESIERTKKSDFSNEGLVGFELYGKTLGILGIGNIGVRVSEIAHGFGMNVLAFNRKPKDIQNITFAPLEQVLQKADIITIHLPLTPETHHLINKDNISLMKKGSFLINTARGPIVETEALVYALQNNLIGGAGVDVLEEEGIIKEERELLSSQFIDLISAKKMLLGHVLQDMPNVIITPHNAFHSKEALREINEITVKNLQ
ncbi:MAG: hydroxyacid dehydrogenase [Candidatus Roizmanbacteria bacterium]|nr:hydroxyacid dehydrogenase [Candidatus Roizmanbacteria bacterium]